MLALLSLGVQRRAYAEERRSDSHHALPVDVHVDDGMADRIQEAPCMSYDREQLPMTKSLLSTYASLIEMVQLWSLQVPNRAMCHYFLCCKREDSIQVSCVVVASHSSSPGSLRRSSVSQSHSLSVTTRSCGKLTLADRIFEQYPDQLVSLGHPETSQYSVV